MGWNCQVLCALVWGRVQRTFVQMNGVLGGFLQEFKLLVRSGIWKIVIISHVIVPLIGIESVVDVGIDFRKGFLCQWNFPRVMSPYPVQVIREIEKPKIWFSVLFEIKVSFR